MKNLLGRFATLALTVGLAASANAQAPTTTNIGVLQLNDGAGHYMTISTPQVGDPGYASWIAGGTLNWKIPIPPSSGANAGFVVPGTSAGQTLVWVAPGGGGGSQGYWNYSAGAGVTTSGTGTTNTLPKFTGASTIANSSISDVAGALTFSGYTTGILHSGAAGAITSSAVALGGADVTGILGVANGGTGTSTAFNAGNIVYAGASGVYTSNNNFGYDATNKTQFLVNGANSLLYLGGGANTGSEVKFNDIIGGNISLYNKGDGKLTFAQTSGQGQPNLAGTVLMTLTTAGSLTLSTYTSGVLHTNGSGAVTAAAVNLSSTDVSMPYRSASAAGNVAVATSDYTVKLTGGGTTGVTMPGAGVATGQIITVWNTTGAGLATGAFVIPNNAAWQLLWDGAAWQHLPLQ